MMLNCGPGTAVATPSSAVTLLFVGSPSVVTLGDWTFLNVTGYNAWYFSLDVVVFAVWKTAESGATIAVETGGASVAAGQTGSFYVPVFNIGEGIYVVTVFGVTPGNNPITLPLQLQITLG